MPSLVHSFFESLATGKPARGAYKPQDKAAAAVAAGTTHVNIIDIRRNTVEASLKEEIHSLFYPHTGPRKLPTLLLYDEMGLQLFEKVGLLPPFFTGVENPKLTWAFKITYLEEYYLTNAEIQVLQRSAAAIATNIPSGTVMLELGSGYVILCSLSSRRSR